MADALDRSWMDRGACRGADVDLWHPSNGDTAAAAKARAVCDTCSVQEECLAYALAVGEAHGIWGGLSPKQRRVLRRATRVKKCRWCERSFESANPRVKLCSDQCRDESRRATQAESYRRTRLAS